MVASVESEYIIIGIWFFLFGIVIGSFLNVCIYRLPKGESLAKERSHCMKCGYTLSWYDLVPVFSYLFLRGRCRKCGEHISAQYPIIEALNGVLYVLIFILYGWSIDSAIYCLLTSALIVLSVIDFRTQEIFLANNGFILALGLIHLGFHLGDWVTFVVGLFAVSIPLALIVIATHEGAMGWGDVFLMGAAGLLIGWKQIIFALVAGCVIGSIIHIIRMRFFGAERRLAMGPYLSVGIFIAATIGRGFVDWYFGLLHFN